MSVQITAAFVYGSVAKKTDTASSDIDWMVISDELHQRIANKESFLTRVLGQPKIWIVGEHNDLGI